MNLQEAERNIRALLAAHNLGHLDVQWSRSTARLAACHFRRPMPWEDPQPFKVSVSRLVAQANTWEALQPVILHEIAHAIAGIRAGHGPAFVNVALAIGGVPTHSHTMPELAAGGWKAQCPFCRKRMRRARLSSRRFHCRCTRSTVGPRPVLTWYHADGRSGTCTLDIARGVAMVDP